MINFRKNLNTLITLPLLMILTLSCNDNAPTKSENNGRVSLSRLQFDSQDLGSRTIRSQARQRMQETDGDLRARVELSPSRRGRRGKYRTTSPRPHEDEKKENERTALRELGFNEFQIAQILQRRYSKDVIEFESEASLERYIPSVQSTFVDPHFGLEHYRATSDQRQNLFNSERNYFNRNNTLYFNQIGNELVLFRAKDGRRLKTIKLPNLTRPARFVHKEVRWSYRWYYLVYPSGRDLRMHNVLNGHDYKIQTFENQIGDHNNDRIAGGDGNRMDDQGEWIILSLGGDNKRLFAYNIKTKDQGPPRSFPNLDYASISPKGKFIVVLDKKKGIEIYDKQWRKKRNLYKDYPHISLGIYEGKEVLLTKVSKKALPFLNDEGLATGDLIQIELETGNVKKVLDWPEINGFPMTGQFLPSSRNCEYFYMAVNNPRDMGLSGHYPYSNEIIEIPKSGNLKIRRLAHLNSIIPQGQSHVAFQAEAWVDRECSRIFYRSNHLGRQGNDLFFFRIPRR